MGLENLTGQTLGRYELQEMLGAGGMGAVYKGFQTNLNREVAIKILPPMLAVNTNFVMRFEREAQTVAALQHPHIVPIYDYGNEKGVMYVVMPLLTGGTLTKRSQTRILTLPEISSLLNDLASALDYAHSRKVIHRDIKPDNIMFDGHNTPFIVDFGIAKLVSEDATAITQGGMSVGTPAFMPPEQWRGDELTPAADQYALAIVIYQLLTGQLPFTATTPQAMMYNHLQAEPIPPDVARPGIPPGVSQVMLKALAKAPTERFPTMLDFARAFGDAQAGKYMPSLFQQPTMLDTPSYGGATGTGGVAVYTSQNVRTAKQRPFYLNPMVIGGVVLALVAIGVILAVVMGGGGADEDGDATSDSQALVDDNTATVTRAVEATDTEDVTATETNAVSGVGDETPTDEPSPTVGARLTEEPTATDTEEPTATNTSEPTATDTEEPTATNTSEPTVTNTAEPTATDTQEPTATDTQEPTFTPLPVSVGITSNAAWTPEVFEFDGVEMVKVPPGCFTMGATEAQVDQMMDLCIPVMGSDRCSAVNYGGEQPNPEYCFTEPYWIDRYEVSNIQFDSFGGQAAVPSAIPDPLYPRSMITWYEASAYCALRGARLPTEPEWLYAARGPDSLVYPWGNEFESTNTNHCDSNCPRTAIADVTTNDGYDTTAPVGSFPSGASWVGAFDMSGNVWDWMSSLTKFLPYDANFSENPDETTIERRLGGGSWDNNASNVSALFRGDTGPDTVGNGIGLRCVRDDNGEIGAPINTALRACLAINTSGNPINARKGPSTDGEIVTAIEANARLLVYGRNESGEWLNVRIGGFEKAWIFAELFEVTCEVGNFPVVGS